MPSPIDSLKLYKSRPIRKDVPKSEPTLLNRHTLRFMEVVEQRASTAE